MESLRREGFFPSWSKYEVITGIMQARMAVVTNLACSRKIGRVPLISQRRDLWILLEYDLPHALFMGWIGIRVDEANANCLDAAISNRFRNYARVCFSSSGRRILPLTEMRSGIVKRFRRLMSGWGFV